MVGWWGGLGVIIKSNLNRARLSCCWVVFGLGCDNIAIMAKVAIDAIVDIRHLIRMSNEASGSENM